MIIGLDLLDCQKLIFPNCSLYIEFLEKEKLHFSPRMIGKSACDAAFASVRIVANITDVANIPAIASVPGMLLPIMFMLPLGCC